MNRLILQTWYDDTHGLHIYENKWTSQIKESSKDSVYKYSKKFNNIDYCLIENEKYFKSTDNCTIEKLRVFDKQFSKYDQILVLDLDIIVKEDSPNIFDFYCQSEFVIRGSGADSTYWTKLPTSDDLMSTINGGVVLWSRKILDVCYDEVMTVHNGNYVDNNTTVYSDEDLIRDLYIYSKFVLGYEWRVEHLERMFNRFSIEYHDMNKPGYFIHYGGDNRNTRLKELWNERT